MSINALGEDCMTPGIFASILAGCLLSAAECMIIIFTCGPFWMKPVIFFQTWLIYSLVMCVGFFVLNTVFPIFPPLQRYFRNQVRRFLLYFTLGWIGGSAALAIIMTRDLDTHRENWAILAVSFALGIAVIFLITRLIKRVP